MLGDRIADLRRQSGLSQRDLATRLQVSPSAIGMYEQNRREPSVGRLVTMAALFDVSLDFLLTGIPDDPRARTSLRDWYREMAETCKDAVLEKPDGTRMALPKTDLAMLLAALLHEQA